MGKLYNLLVLIVLAACQIQAFRPFEGPFNGLIDAAFNRPFNGPRRPGNNFRPPRPPRPQQTTLSLCTYDSVSYTKCIHTVHVAQNSSINLGLQCVQKDTREECVRAVDLQHIDMIVVRGDDYKKARQADLYPVLFERDGNASVYIAVAPRDIGLVEIATAPIDVDPSNHRAFHAAAFFNLRRGHDICNYLQTIRETPSIRIVDSAEYVPTNDEILICPDNTWAEASYYGACNFEANLQRAIFVSRRAAPDVAFKIKRILNTLLERFGLEAATTDGLNDNNFSFFSAYDGHDDVIFKNNAEDFDFQPTYLNGVNEAVFNKLHCDTDDQNHDPRELE